MIIDAEAIQRIAKLAHDAKPILEAPDYEDTGRFYVRQADGSLQQVYADREPDSTRLYDTGSLAEAVNDEHANDMGIVVFYSSARIAAVVTDPNDSWRQHQHIMRLERHPSFKRLERLLSTEALTQRELIRLLRAEFNGHVEDPVVEQFRKLRLSTTGKGESVVAKGREAVDRSITNEVTAAAGQQIPDEITVTLPVHDLDESRDKLQSVRILVEARQDDNGQATFELTTVLNDLRAAERAALDHLVELLKGKLPAGVALLYGEPV